MLPAIRPKPIRATFRSPVEIDSGVINWKPSLLESRDRLRMPLSVHTDGLLSNRLAAIQGTDGSRSMSDSARPHLLGSVESNDSALKPFECRECFKRFTQCSSLKAHMRIHTGERPFTCDFEGCGKAFAVLSSLRTHRRIHTGERPFPCNVCGKRFILSGDLRKHMRIHTGERPFVCMRPDCGRAFSQSSSLQRHYKVHMDASSGYSPREPHLSLN